MILIRRIVKGDLHFVNVGHSHTCNIYRGGREVDMFSFGDFGKNSTTYSQFKSAVKRHLKFRE